MSHLDILICMSPDRFFPQIVMDHMLIQNIPFRLFFSNAKGDGSASARNFVKEMWEGAHNKSRYVLMTDNDIIFPPGSMEAMINFLEQNQDFGAISLYRQNKPEAPIGEAVEPKHINAGPVLFRPKVLQQITYHNNNGCECQGMSDDVRKLGFRIGYLGGWQYDHINQTRRNDMDEQQPLNLPLESLESEAPLSEPAAQTEMPTEAPEAPTEPIEVPPEIIETADEVIVEEAPEPPVSEPVSYEVQDPAPPEPPPIEPISDIPVPPEPIPLAEEVSEIAEAEQLESPEAGTEPPEEEVAYDAPEEFDAPPVGLEEEQVAGITQHTQDMVVSLLQTISEQLAELIRETRAIKISLGDGEEA